MIDDSLQFVAVVDSECFENTVEPLLGLKMDSAKVSGIVSGLTSMLLVRRVVASFGNYNSLA